MNRDLCDLLHSSIAEQIERLDHLVSLVPAEELDWKPSWDAAWPAGVLLGHLLECLAGFCAALVRASPARLAHFQALRDLPVNHRCGPSEARERIALYHRHIQEGFAELTDADLGRTFHTVFGDDALLSLLMRNLEHLTNHKFQLFTYLKCMNIAVGSRDLYRFR